MEGSKEPNIGYWTNLSDSVTWQANITQPGEFEVTFNLACAPGSDGSEFTFTAGNAKLSGKTTATAGWEDYKQVNIGRIRIDQPGNVSIGITATSKPGMAVMNLRSDHPQTKRRHTEMIRQKSHGRLPGYPNPDDTTPESLLMLVYEKLRRLAAKKLAGQGDSVMTLQPTALVHEAWLRLSEFPPDFQPCRDMVGHRRGANQQPTGRHHGDGGRQRTGVGAENLLSAPPLARRGHGPIFLTRLLRRHPPDRDPAHGRTDGEPEFSPRRRLIA